MRGTRMKCIHFWTTFRVFGLKCCYSDTMSLKYIWRLYRNQYIIFVLVGPPCATCDENMECLVDYVCDVSEACFIGTYNSSFTIRCMKVTLHPYIENIKERRKFKRLWLPPPFFLIVNSTLNKIWTHAWFWCWIISIYRNLYLLWITSSWIPDFQKEDCESTKPQNPENFCCNDIPCLKTNLPDIKGLTNKGHSILKNESMGYLA